MLLQMDFIREGVQKTICGIRISIFWWLPSEFLNTLMNFIFTVLKKS
jgi:hypothetical protein